MTRLRLLPAALAVLLLAGCTTIPTSGTVGRGETEAPADPTFQYIPNPPAAGADPEEIVAGFVQAGSGNDGYVVAREFLTPELAARWRPDARVLVHDRSWTIEPVADDQVRLTVPTSGVVDKDGVYRPSPGEVPVPFELQQVSGQWRISAAPDGVIVSQTAFPRVFDPETLQFFDPASSRLVPDLRWLPARGSHEPALVRALLNGPAAPLRRAVAPTAPAGTKLRRVTAGASGTTVALDIPGAQPDRRTTDRLQQQLIRTLRPLRPQSELRLIVNGRLVPTAPALQIEPRNGSPMVVAGDEFGVLSPTGLTADAALGPRIVAAQPRAVTVSVQQQLAAVLTPEGVAAVDAKGTRLLDDRPGLRAPTLDQRGWIYAVPEDDPLGLVAYRKDGKAVPLRGRLSGSDITSIEVSPDGTRMLVLVQADSGPGAYVYGIERAEDGTPTKLTTNRFPLVVQADSALGATWVDDGSVAILASGTDAQEVLLQQVGGLSSSLGRLPALVVGIVGGTRQDNLRLVTAGSGDLFIRRSSIWSEEFPTDVEVSVLAVQR